VLTAEELAVRAEARIKKNNERVQRKLARLAVQNSDGEEVDDEGFDRVPDGNSDGELNDDEYDRAQQAAAARPGASARIDQVIERLCAKGGVNVPSSPPPRLPPHLQNIGM